MSVYASDQMFPAEGRAKAAADMRTKMSWELSEDDRLKLREWLTKQVVAWRVLVALHVERLDEFWSYIRRIRILFGFLVTYLVLVTFGALLAAS